MSKAISVFIIFVVFAITSVSYAATYYVRTDGHDTASGANDTNNTTTGGFLTIQHGVNSASCGDTVIVDNGTYTQPTSDAFITIANSCTSGSVFTIKAQNKWGAVLQAYATASRELINITGNYIKVDGFKLQGWVYGTVYSPLLVAGNYNTVTNIYSNQNQYVSINITGNYNTLSNSYILKPEWGIWISGTGNSVLNNEVDQLVVYLAGNDADYMRFGGSNHTIQGNYFHGANLSVLNAGGDYGNAHVDCFQTFTEGGGQNSNNILIKGNWCQDSNEGVMASADSGTSTGLTVINNVFVNQTAYGVAIGGNYLNVLIYNNTFDQQGGIYGVGCDWGVASGPSCDVRNNIFYNGGSGTVTPIYISGGATWITPPVNNLFYSAYRSYSLSNWSHALGSKNIVNQNPLFVSSSNYHLQSGSPARDTGATIVSVTNDYAGTARPSNAKYDIGAYGYNKPDPPRLLRITN